MSFARFSDSSDVYVYSDVGGYIACCGCILGDKWDYHSVDEIVAHMEQHVTAGHTIPSDLLDPETYDGETFVPMCAVFMCREDEGHEGLHTPLRDYLELVRARVQGMRSEGGAE